MAHATCVVCGQPSSGKRKYCSEQCKWKARPRIACSACGGKTGQTRASVNKTICRSCQTKMPGEHGSDRMYNKFRCRCQICKSWASARVREYRDRTGYKPKTRPKKTITCAYHQCRKQFDVRSGSNTRYCSIKCSRAHLGTWNKRCTQLAVYKGPKFQRKPRANGNPIPLRNGTFKSVQCRHCRKMFITLNNDMTCSEHCFKQRDREQRKICRDRRRARKKKAYVADVWRNRVYLLDNYKCHICKRPTDPSKSVPHPRAPTVDHVIPLAQGGTHEPANCRTACFQCNSIKGDRGGGEQLALIG